MGKKKIKKGVSRIPRITYIPLTTKELLLSLLIFWISFFIYLRTMAPTIIFWDNGEFIACSYLLGTAHPTGYPTYTLIAKLISYLPLGSIALRINLLSALLASIGATVVYCCIQRLIHRLTISIPSALLITVSGIFWSQATSAEVLIFNAFFMIILTLILIQWGQSRDIKWLYLLTFTCGLSFSNHLLTVLLIPGFLWYLLATDRRVFFNIRTLIILMALFILGVFPYVYLPIRFDHNPYVALEDLTTIKGMLNHLSGKLFQKAMFTLPPDVVLRNLRDYGILLLKQFSPFLLPLILVGIWRLIKEDLKLLIMLLSIILCILLYAINYDFQADIPPYYIPTFICFIILIAYGVKHLIEKIPKPQFRYLILIFFILSPIGICFANFNENNLRKYYFAWDYGMNIFRHLPDSAVLFNRADFTHCSLRYLRFVEGVKTDVPIITTHILSYPSYIKKIKKQYPWLNSTPTDNSNTAIFNNLVEKHIGTVPIYYTFRDDQYLRPIPYQSTLIKEGLLYKLTHRETEKVTFDYKNRYLLDSTVTKDLSVDDIITEYGYAYAELGEYYGNQGVLNLAIAYVKKAVQYSPQNASFLALLGILYHYNGMTDKAIDSLNRAIQIDPQNPDYRRNLAICKGEKE